MNVDFLDLAILKTIRARTAYAEEVESRIIADEKKSERVLTQQLVDAAEMNWVRHAVSNATFDTLKFIVEELAKVRKEDPEEVLASYQRLRTILFNRELNDDIRNGYLKNDPRRPGSGDHSRILGAWYDRSIDPGM